MKQKIIWMGMLVLGLVIAIFFLTRNDSSVNETAEMSSQTFKITDDAILINNLQVQQSGENFNNMESLQLVFTSSDFENGENIPSQYTCDGENINPNFEIAGVSPGAKSLVLIMDDPDAPGGVWDHWIKFNIPVTTTSIKAGVEPEGTAGTGTGDNTDYSGPCPPDRQHRYFFKLYSLDTELTLPVGSSKAEVEEAMKGHILQTVELMGLYERQTD